MVRNAACGSSIAEARCGYATGPSAGIAHRRCIQIHECILGQFPCVVESKAHDEIVRMLRVRNRLAESRLPGLKEQRIPAVGDRSRFETHHQVRLKYTFRSRAMRSP